MRVGIVALVAGSLTLLQGAGGTLVLSSDGLTVYDSGNGITWLANANLPAANRFGLPVCGSSAIDTKTCVNASGSMSYQAAASWVQAMNAANYLGHSNWQIPTTPIVDGACSFVGPQNNSFGWGCAASALASPLAGPLAAALQAGIQALVGLAFSDCDGLVASQPLVYQKGRDVQNLIATKGTNGKFAHSTTFLGNDSPSGCGGDSNYQVFWSITLAPPPYHYHLTN